MCSHGSILSSARGERDSPVSLASDQYPVPSVSSMVPRQKEAVSASNRHIAGGSGRGYRGWKGGRDKKLVKLSRRSCGTRRNNWQRAGGRTRDGTEWGRGPVEVTTPSHVTLGLCGPLRRFVRRLWVCATV